MTTKLTYLLENYYLFDQQIFGPLSLINAINSMTSIKDIHRGPTLRMALHFSNFARIRHKNASNLGAQTNFAAPAGSQG